MWKLTPHDWINVHNLIKLKGIEAMADYAARAAERSGQPVGSARYFLNGWKELPPAPPAGMPAAPPRADRRPGPDERAAATQALKQPAPDQPLRLIRGDAL